MIRLFTGLIALALIGCAAPKVVYIPDPLNAKQHNDLGVAYQKNGKVELAIKEFSRAVKQDDRWSLPRFNLGNAYAETGDWETARRNYLIALRLDPENPAILNNLAIAESRLGNRDEAIQYASRAVSLAPDDPNILDTLTQVSAPDAPNERGQ